MCLEREHVLVEKCSIQTFVVDSEDHAPSVGACACFKYRHGHEGVFLYGAVEILCRNNGLQVHSTGRRLDFDYVVGSAMCIAAGLADMADASGDDFKFGQRTSHLGEPEQGPVASQVID